MHDVLNISKLKMSRNRELAETWVTSFVLTKEVILFKNP